jgi:hypothetical protein
MNFLNRLAVPLFLGLTGSALAGGCVPGEPIPSGDSCGGIAGRQCEDPEEFCNFPLSTQCGSGDQTGVCSLAPEACNKIYDPVCGCDGKTYGNACEAASNEVSVQAKGACPTPGDDVCGGLLGKGCADDEFCSYPPEAQCGAADQTGTCARKPEACTLQYAPVCGCDDKTYGNACSAASAGVSVVHTGECTK